MSQSWAWSEIRAPCSGRWPSGCRLRLWDGTVDDPGRLAFVGEKARTLILAPPGRGWMPTGRPAEPHPLEVTLAGVFPGEVELAGTPYRIRSV